MSKYSTPTSVNCSFCHKHQRDVGKIIAGPDVYICSDCIRLCLDIMKDASEGTTPTVLHSHLPAIPAQIKSHLDNYVVGQEAAKRRLAVAVYNHYKRLQANSEDDTIQIKKSNILIIGPTGTGKTLMAQTLAQLLDVPFVITDATTLTEAGYVGEDVENVITQLYHASGNSKERTERGIIYLDEIDKIARKTGSYSTSRDVSGEGVQQALLKLLEGSVCTIQARGNKRSNNSESLQINTKDILFVCGGSFEGLAPLIEQRLGRRSVGFNRSDQPEPLKGETSHNTLHNTTTDDLEQFGLIPELIGRIPVIAVMNPLTTDDLVHILVEPRNALIKQYQTLFKFDNIELSFTEEAIWAIAEQAAERLAGARGLRATLEHMMLDIMFEVPSLADVRRVVITEQVVRQHQSPDYDTVKAVGLSG